MTERDTFQAMLMRAGVKFEVEEREGGVTVVSIESNTGEKNMGYFGFFTEFTFTPDDTLDRVGVWE